MSRAIPCDKGGCTNFARQEVFTDHGPLYFCDRCRDEIFPLGADNPDYTCHAFDREVAP